MGEVVKLQPTFKIPETHAECADLIYSTRQKRLALQKQVDEMERQESELREHLIRELPKSNASGIAGRLARVTVVEKNVPAVEDWETLFKYVKRTGAFELLQKRLAAPAIQERWDAGKKVPGVGVFNAVTLSVNKV